MPLRLQNEELLTITMHLYSFGMLSELLLSLRSKTWLTASYSRKQHTVTGDKEGTVDKNKRP